MEETWNTVKPNDGHRAVAELVARGMVSHVITQNIDNLHQASGVPDDQVIELHGNTRYAKCLDCGARVEIADIRAHFDSHGDAPDCAALRRHRQDRHHLLRPGHAGSAKWRGPRRRRLACDLLLVLGSSLVVYPAAGFPLLAKRNGARLVDPQPRGNRAGPLCRSGHCIGEIGPTLTRGC